MFEPSLLPMMNVAGIVEAGFIPKCIAMIFLLRMQMLSILLPSEENLNKEVPNLPFSEHLMVARCPQKTGTSCLFRMSHEFTALPLPEFRHSMSIYLAVGPIRKGKAVS